MKLKLPPDVSSVSVNGIEYAAPFEGGIVDVGNLAQEQVDKLVLHAKCIPAGPDDEAAAAKEAVEIADKKASVLKALADLGVKADGRTGIAKLQEMLATARLAAVPPPPITPAPEPAPVQISG